MLSAVAARKARLSQSQAQTPLQSTPSTPSPSSPPPPPDASKKVSAASKPPSKRKPVAPTGNVSKKRRGHSRKASPPQTPRYFSQPFKTQDDVIVVDGSDSDTSSTSPDILSDVEDTHVSISNHHNPRILPRRRGWSPSAPLPDSSDEEGGGMDDLTILDLPLPSQQDRVRPQPPSTLSTFRPVLNQNVFCLAPSQICNDEPLRKRTVLLLTLSDSVALLGTYSISVLQGAVTLGGVSVIAPSASLPVFAPRSAPLPIIQCSPLKNSTSDPSALQNLPHDVAKAAESFDAVVMLQELQTGIEGLGKICRTFDGFFAPSRWHRDQVRFDLGLDTVYFLSHRTPDIIALDVPSSWDAAFKTICPTSSDENEFPAQRSAYLVRGSKNTGKSTFARLILNQLLAKFQCVAYLECDLGQSEFTPGGMVSLSVVEQPIFGPPFSHPSIPYAAHYVGATSPKTTPSHYIDSVQALVQLYELEIQNPALEELGLEGSRISSFIPLVVNTMGWTKGLGADLSRKLEGVIQPSHVFSFDASVNDDWDAPTPFSSSSGLDGGQIHSLESVRPSSISNHYTAADQRNLSMLSYFHATFSNHTSTSPLTSPIATSWNSALPLCAQHPYEVDARTAFDQLFLVGAGTEDVVADEVPRALTCSVVGLVSCQPGTLEDHALVDADADDGPTLPFYEQGAPPPSPYASRCIGLAVVRAISPAPSPRIQLLTPIPPNLLGSARVLVMGELPLPVWGMLDFRTLDDGGDIVGYERGKVPYLRWGKGEGAGGDRRRVRRNLMRRGQM